ncbi:hypothetical protein KEM56_000417 [Ascosphaera pollenicola]|nr:hypothetical protein KEM56_000417 [Ascosphaera pollenicola]
MPTRLPSSLAGRARLSSSLRPHALPRSLPLYGAAPLQCLRAAATTIPHFGATALRRRCYASIAVSPATLVTTQTTANSVSRPSSPLLRTPDAIPQGYRELYEALAELKGSAAGEFVNLNRLQFAMKGLEVENAPARVAVLDLGDDLRTSLKLVRCLLCDPLSSKAEWETYLESSVDPSRGLLIKYGENTELSMPNTVLPTITIPSRVLKTNNIEILISPLGAQPLKSTSSSNGQSIERLLVPAIPLHSPVGNQYTLAPFPVHKTIVCGEGVDGLLSYGTIIGSENISNSYSDTIQAAFQVHAQSESASIAKGVSFIDTDRAINALEKFRLSAKNAPEYEKGWTASNVQALIDWLPKSAEAGQGLRNEMKKLISLTLGHAELNIKEGEQRALNYAHARTVPDIVRKDLSIAVDFWAERNHTELREELERGFASPSWKNLAWWKLFWHVDDVGMITEEILRRRWLNRAEAETLWIGGRLRQAGLLKEDINNGQHGDVTESKITKHFNKLTKLLGTSVQEQDPAQAEDGLQHKSMALWPSTLYQARTNLITSTVNPLHALAQRLVLFSISTTSLTSALSILTYLSSPTITLYEAGVIATVGLYVSLRRQQKNWDAARLRWEQDVYEQGRQELKNTEDYLRKVIDEEGRAEPELGHIIDAKTRVEKVREALRKLD